MVDSGETTKKFCSQDPLLTISVVMRTSIGTMYDTTVVAVLAPFLYSYEHLEPWTLEPSVACRIFHRCPSAQPKPNLSDGHCHNNFKPTNDHEYWVLRTGSVRQEKTQDWTSNFCTTVVVVLQYSEYSSAALCAFHIVQNFKSLRMQPMIPVWSVEFPVVTSMTLVFAVE